MAKYEFVDDEEQDDKLVTAIVTRENELFQFENEAELYEGMLANAEQLVPKSGDAKADAQNLQAYREMCSKTLAQIQFQMAKSRGIYAGYKARAEKNPQRHAAAVARFKAKK